MFTIGDLVSIFIGGAVAHSAVCVTMLHGTIVAMTEKAIQLRLDNSEKIWLPKKALRADPKTDSFRLARWFKPSGYQARAIERNQTISGISAA
jgi:hypothetical protein